MRILATTELWFPDYVGGSARVARETAVALAKRGHEVVMLAPAPNNERTNSVVEGIDLYRWIRRSNVVPRTYTDIWMYSRETSRLPDRHFDVILGHHVGSMLGAARALPSVPLAHVFHASGLREARQRRAFGVGKAATGRSLAVEPALWGLERLGARRPERLLVLSEFSRSLLMDDHGPRVESKIVNVGGGVDTARYRPAEDRSSLRAQLGVADGEIALLTVRRLVQRMGLDNLLKAFAQLVPNHSNLRLVIVGDGELRQTLHELSRALEIEHAVVWAGRVSDSELVSWYQAADLFVLPTAAYEGFGISTVESLACGTPVVGTPVGATPEVLAGLGDRFLAADPTAAGIADSVEAVLSSLGPELRTHVREYAVSHLDWDVVVRQWEESLEQIRRG